MFVGVGVGAYAAGIFHLVTHAFFKALLFLGAGSVIHGLHGEQDLRKMGGLKSKMLTTTITFLVGALGLAGVPPLAGFFSKDEILAATYFEGHRALFLILLAGAFMTAFYTFRLVILAFFGAPRMSQEARRHVHESPTVMTLPLVVLAVLTVVAGVALGAPSSHGTAFARFLAPVLPLGKEDHGAAGKVLLLVSVLVAVAGVLSAWMAYGRRPIKAEEIGVPRYALHALLLNKYYVDEIYDAAIVQPIRVASQDGLWRGFDVKIIDGAVNGAATIVNSSATLLRRLQTGSVKTYAGSVFVGVVAILAYYLWL
jgi:NADH-quinone oxidoreductase subunit L